MDPRLGTDSPGPGKAVFAIRFNGKPEIVRKTLNFRTRKEFEKNPNNSYLDFFGTN